jgi:release factor glutamine methyltransferase
VTLDEAAHCLAGAGIEGARREARLLMAHALGVSRDATLTAALTPQQKTMFAALVARRAAREPFAYITGRKEFWSLEFDVGPGVLIPRPDTETLIEQALRFTPDRNAPLAIADLGAGSGALLVAALTEFPNATGTGFESSPQAFAYLSRNIARHIPHRGQAHLASWDAAAGDTAGGPFDLVFSNPPYIPAGDIESLAPDVSRYEPLTALDGGKDGLDAYRALAGLLPAILKPGGLAILEIGAGQGNSVEPLFQSLETVALASDLGGIARALVLRKS